MALPKHLPHVLLKYAMVTALMAFITKMFVAYDDLQRYEPHFSMVDHPYVPPSKGDSRSPCPALNALANHNYLPHDGRGITRDAYIRALRDGYNLSIPLATLLTYGSHMILAQYSSLSLADLARHNFIEHSESLGHADVIGDEEYAPSEADPQLISQLINASSNGHSMDIHDFTRARLRREEPYEQPLDPLHEEIARGEMSMVLGIFGQGNEAVPVRWLNDWWLNERFPEDWEPKHEQTLLKTVRTSYRIKQLMQAAEGQ
ncbi:predicted protein [Sparassis crispa]|uniref:Heme haloperoxidase family profile domain-containing protein n=1 Tax=Sparassis crispa TaxID=139825 RepID=A0A401G9V5_9APHY|nr:predicted protein [Sparassis crispa]GBE78913.1 predicted protein [Sparassis crispa]